MITFLVGELEEDLLAFDSSNCSPYFLKNWCEPRSHLMPMSSACWSLPCSSRSVPSAKMPLAAPLKNRNVGRDSRRGSRSTTPQARPRGWRCAFSSWRDARTPAAAGVAGHAGRACRTRGRCARVAIATARRRARTRDRCGCRRPRLTPCRAAVLAGPEDLTTVWFGSKDCDAATSSTSLDVGAEELEGAVAGLADQVEVPGLPVGVLEPRPPLTESTLRAMPASTIHAGA